MEVKTKIYYKDIVLNKDIKKGKDLIKEYENAKVELTNDRLDVLLEGNASSNYKPFVEVKLDDMDEVATSGGGGTGTMYAPRRISFSDYGFMNYPDGSEYDMKDEVTNIDASKIETLYGSFARINGVSKLDLSSWNTPMCQDYSFVFDESSFEYIDVSNFSLDSAWTVSNFIINCYNLKTLILGANWLDVTSMMLEDTGGLSPGGDIAMTPFIANTPINDGNGFIYVPDELVQDFKDHEVFSEYASLIKPKSEL